MVDIINLENLVALLFVKIEEVPKQWIYIDQIELN
jgi:hypothetical protein